MLITRLFGWVCWLGLLFGWLFGVVLIGFVGGGLLVVVWLTCFVLCLWLMHCVLGLVCFVVGFVW